MSEEPTDADVARWHSLSDAQSTFEMEHESPRDRAAGPLWQAWGRERLEQERAKFETGDKMALLAALRVCAARDLPMPEWTSRAFISAYDEVLNCRSNSWDKVFGKPYPKKHMADLRRRRKLRPAIWSRITQIRSSQSPAPTFEVLFESVGKEFHISKTLCGELYYEFEFVTGSKATLPPK